MACKFQNTQDYLAQLKKKQSQEAFEIDKQLYRAHHKESNVGDLELQLMCESKLNKRILSRQVHVCRY